MGLKAPHYVADRDDKPVVHDPNVKIKSNSVTYIADIPIEVQSPDPDTPVLVRSFPAQVFCSFTQLSEPRKTDTEILNSWNVFQMKSPGQFIKVNTFNLKSVFKLGKLTFYGSFNITCWVQRIVFRKFEQSISASIAS